MSARTAMNCVSSVLRARKIQSSEFHAMVLMQAETQNDCSIACANAILITNTGQAPIATKRDKHITPPIQRLMMIFRGEDAVRRPPNHGDVEQTHNTLYEKHLEISIIRVHEKNSVPGTPSEGPPPELSYGARPSRPWWPSRPPSAREFGSPG